jgi:glycosyltransferase involved in cell wall biosynthesis
MLKASPGSCAFQVGGRESNVSGMPAKPYLSVVLLCFERREFLCESLTSVLNQTLDQDLFEIFVVGDVNPHEVCPNLDSSRVQYIHSRERAVGPKYELALRNTRGEVIAFLDDDDYWDPSRLATIAREFRSAAELGYYHNHSTPVDASGHFLSLPRFLYAEAEGRKSAKLIPGLGINYQRVCDMMARGMAARPSAIAVRRSILMQRLDYIRRLRISADVFLFYLALLSHCDLMDDPSRLTFYRIHDASSSNSKGGNLAEFVNLSLSRRERFRPDDTLLWEMVCSQPEPYLIKSAQREVAELHIRSSWYGERRGEVRLAWDGLDYFRFFSWAHLRTFVYLELMTAMFLIWPRGAQSLCLWLSHRTKRLTY